MESILGQNILSLMGITFNFSTGEIGWSSGTTASGDAATYDFMDDTDFLFMDDTGFDFMDA